jgi:hypothetical protein
VGELAFESGPLPGAGKRAGGNSLEAQLGDWLRSEPMRHLIAHCGWKWPDTGSVQALAHRLADLSAGWDFRGQASARAGTSFTERAAMPVDDAITVDGRTVAAQPVLAAAEALGLVSTRLDDGADATHLVVLSGTARANVNRVGFASEMTRRLGDVPRHIIGLAAHRELGDAERSACADLGLAATDTEWTTLRDALTRTFGLGEPVKSIESGPDAGDRSTRFGRSASYYWNGAHGTSVQLHVVPSPAAADAKPRPANTEQQLRWWAGQCDDLGANSRVVLVTTQIYVPYQHLTGLRVLLAAAPGARVSTVGVAANNSALATRKFTGSDYLQEIRSALLAARALADVLASKQL